MKIMHKSAALAAAMILTAGISVQAADVIVHVTGSADWGHDVSAWGKISGKAIAGALEGQDLNVDSLTVGGHSVDFGGLDDLKGKVDSNSKDITDLQGDVKTNSQNITGLQKQFGDLSTNYNTTRDVVTELYNKVSGTDGLESQVSQNTTQIGDLDSQINGDNGLNEQVSDLSSNYNNTRNVVAELYDKVSAPDGLESKVSQNTTQIGALDSQINGDNGLAEKVDSNFEAIEGLRQKVDTDTVNADTVNADTVNAGTVNGDSLSIAGGKFQVAENGDVYAQNGNSQFQVRDDYLGMNYGPNTYIGLNEDGVSISSKGYQIDGATGDIATDGTLSVGQGANINGGLAVNGGANINGGLTVDGMDVGGSIAQNTTDIKKNTAAINQETADRTAADQILQQGIQNNSNAISSLNSRVSDLSGEIDNVGAISAALAGLHPLDYDGTGSKFQLAAAMGDYDGSQAAAIGGFYHFNEDVMMSVGGATVFDGNKKTAFNVGVSFRVGSGSSAKRLNSDDVIAQLAAMNDKIAALEAENQKLTEKVAALQDSEAAPKA